MTLTKTKTRYREAFVYAFGIAIIIFLPFVLWENGYFFFYGDFNVQQIPFYQLAHDAVKSGNIAWNWNTDLGVNFVGSYSFYLLGSPFFWITLLFPSSWVIYLIAPLLVIKFATASFTAYCYLQHHVKNSDYALIGALLYAFSGFSTYNIFYNHFHEVIAFFPLLLISVDLLMEGKARGFFAFSVLLNCLTNYFFFVGEVVFVAIYWIIKVISKQWTVRFKHVATIAFEGICGLLSASVLLIPALMALTGNSRSTDLYTGWNMLLYSNGQVFLYIIQSMFFMPELPARPVFFPDAGVQWSSVSAWLPLFGMTGVLSFCMSNKRHWIKRLLITCGVMALIPILNSTFVLFRDSYYARWFYMPILIMALATVKSFEETGIKWNKGIKWSAIITAGFALLIGFLPNSQNENGIWNEFGIYSRDFEVYPARFWAYVFVSALCLFLTYRFVRRIKNDSKYAYRKVLPVLLLIVIVTNIYFIAAGKSYAYDTDTYILPKAVNGAEDIELNDDGYYRIDVIDGMDNLGMYWGYESINCFHSIVPAAVTEFYESIGVERSVATRPEAKHYPLRSLVSAKYVFIDNDDDFEVPGYTYLGVQNGFGVWKNDNFIPMGFSYDKYITVSEYEELENDMDREQILLQAVVIEDEDEDAVKQIYDHYEIGDDIRFEYSDFENACNDRRNESCKSFERNGGYFTAETVSDSEELVFFSVPYDKGWSAKVNGEEVEIYNVNVGFMAVKVPAGDSVIEFTYETPGLRVGTILTCVFVPVMVLYVIIGVVLRRRTAM